MDDALMIFPRFRILELFGRRPNASQDTFDIELHSLFDFLRRDIGKRLNLRDAALLTTISKIPKLLFGVVHGIDILALGHVIIASLFLVDVRSFGRSSLARRRRDVLGTAHNEEVSAMPSCEHAIRQSP